MSIPPTRNLDNRSRAFVEIRLFTLSDSGLSRWVLIYVKSTKSGRFVERCGKLSSHSGSCCFQFSDCSVKARSWDKSRDLIREISRGVCSCLELLSDLNCDALYSEIDAI